MAQRATGAAKRPVRAKTNRADAADPNRSSRDAELDESKFASLTADMFTRRRDAQSFRLAPPPESSNPAPDENKAASFTAGFLVQKGEAGPSVINTQAAQANA